MTNRFINIPERGDIVVRDISTKITRFIQLSTFVLSGLDTSAYEILGVVYYRCGREVRFVYKNNTSAKYCNRAWWYLSNYTLDGTEQTIVFSLYFASNSWASPISKTISYTATTTSELITQLNNIFLTDTDFTAQDWFANLESDGKIRIHCNNISWQQCNYNKATSGITMSIALPEITYLASMRRKSGYTGGEGAISNWYRALTYFRNDNSSTTYNPNSDVTSIKRSYPICLPGYLGTSSYQSDHCSLLRSTYGEGEDGWKKFMRSCLPVYPIGTGNMAQKFGKEMGLLYGPKTYTSNTQTTALPMMNAFSYAYNLSGQTFSKGDFWVPTVEDLAWILSDIQYGTSSDRNVDTLNKALNTIGGSAISNGSYLWSCCRYNTHCAWCALGGGGFFSYNGMYYSYGVLPVSLLNL